MVGLSKIPRLIHAIARRLQTQERITHQIAHLFQKHVDPLGVGVVIRGQHTCMQLRGIQSDGRMTTSCLLGTMFDKGRDEFLSLVSSPL